MHIVSIEPLRWVFNQYMTLHKAPRGCSVFEPNYDILLYRDTRL